MGTSFSQRLFEEHLATELGLREFVFMHRECDQIDAETI